MKNHQAQTPQNLALTVILQKFRKMSTPSPTERLRRTVTIRSSCSNCEIVSKVLGVQYTYNKEVYSPDIDLLSVNVKSNFNLLFESLSDQKL